MLVPDAVRIRVAALLRRPLAADVGAVLPPWLVARALVALGWAVATVAVDDFRPGYRPYQLERGLFAWDGAFYRDLAEDGYAAQSPSALRFFPLVPLLGRAVGVLVPGGAGVGVVIVSNVAALGAGVLLYRLAVEETGDHGLGVRAAWLLMLLPAAMVLVLGYAESTLLLLSIGCFLALRRRNFEWAALAGLLAGLSRPVGALLVLPAAIEALRPYGSLPRRTLPRLAAVVAPAVGVCVYLAWVEYRFGDWMLPLRAQSAADLRGDWANPLTRAAESVGALAGEDRFGDGLHAPWIVLYLVLLVLALRRWPLSYGVYAGALLLVALSAESLGSFERYGLAAFPLVLVLAAAVGRRRSLDRAVLALAAGGFAAYAVLAFLGAFVP